MKALEKSLNHVLRGAHMSSFRLAAGGLVCIYQPSNPRPRSVISCYRMGCPLPFQGRDAFARWNSPSVFHQHYHHWCFPMCSVLRKASLYASPSSHTSRSAQLHELAFAVRKCPVLHSLLITLILWPLRVSQPVSPLRELCDLDFFAPPTSFLVGIFSL